MAIIKTCKQCGQPFACGTGTTHPAHEKFCTPECANTFWANADKYAIAPAGLRL